MTEKIHTMDIVDTEYTDEAEPEAPETGTITVPIEAIQLISAAPSGVDILNVCIDMAVFLAGKNLAYGDSALNPVRAFSKADPKEQILVRMDDKINRLMKGSNYADEDTLKDLLGYLVLYFVAVAKDE